jgi:hypothetical protein
MKKLEEKMNMVPNPLRPFADGEEQVTGELIEAIAKDNEGDLTKDAMDDYESVRSNLDKITETGNDALELAMDIVKDSEKPSAIDAVANLIRSLRDANMSKLELQEKIKELRKTNDRQGAGRDTVNNNLILTTDALQKMLAGTKPLNV